MSESREDVLRTIAAMARDHGLTVEEIATALGEQAPVVSESSSEGAEVAMPAPGVIPEPSGSVVSRVIGYLGATIAFAGLVIFIAMQWEEMNAAARIVITLGSGVAFFAMAIIAHRDERFSRAAVPLFLVAAALQSCGILVTCDEFSSGGDWRLAVLLMAAIMTLQQGVVFRATQQTVLLFTTLVFGLVMVGETLDLLDVDEGLLWCVLGASTLSFSLAIDRSSHRAISPFWYLVGSAAFLGGLFDMVEGTPVELLFLAAVCGLIYLSTAVRSRTLLLVSTIAILGYISYFTAEHFVDTVGWPIALMLLGLLMVGVSALAVRVNRKYIRSR